MEDTYTFPEKLKERLKELKINQSELSRRSGLKKQNISRIINKTPHPITNTPARTSEDVVQKIANALNWDINDALLSAGYAPKEIPTVYQQKIAHLFECSVNWSGQKKERVYEYLKGFVELLESKNEES